MTALIYAVACVALCVAVARLRVLSRARQEAGSLWAAVSALRAPGLTDEQREHRARQAALAALAGTSGLLLRIFGALAAAALPVGLAEVAGLVPAWAVAGFALRPDVLIATTLAVALAVAIGRRVRRTRT